MNGCTNRRIGEDGQDEDPLTFEPVIPEQVVTIIRGTYRFCYNAIGLLRHLSQQHQQGHPPTLPETRDELEDSEVLEIYQIARNSFPQVYSVVIDNQASPYLFDTLEPAVVYANRRGTGIVYQLAQLNDPSLTDLLYPDGLEGVPRVYELLQLPVEPRVPWEIDEGPVREFVLERYGGELDLQDFRDAQIPREGYRVRRMRRDGYSEEQIRAEVERELGALQQQP